MLIFLHSFNLSLDESDDEESAVIRREKKLVKTNLFHSVSYIIYQFVYLSSLHICIFRHRALRPNIKSLTLMRWKRKMTATVIADKRKRR